MVVSHPHRVVNWIMRFIGVIPARYHSTRFPGKALIEIAGKPLIQWVYDRAIEARQLDDLLVATDDLRILRAVESFGGKAVMTRSDHPSGTDRVSEVAQTIEADVFVNIQGDQPLISPGTIERVCFPFERGIEVQVTTARVEIDSESEIQDPNVVKVVVDGEDRALYFSRSVIPYPRQGPARFFKHLGIYAYRRQFLQTLSQLEPSPLEKNECLEQLRFLENGVPIQVIEVSDDSPDVDTQEDISRVRPLLENTVLTEGKPGP